MGQPVATVATDGMWSSQGMHGKPLPLLIVLVPAVPVLALWSANSAALRSLYPLRIIAVLVGITLVLASIVTIVQRDVRRSTLIAAVAVTATSNIGYVLKDPSATVVNLSVLALSIATAAIVVVRLPERAIRLVTILLSTTTGALVVANSVLVLADRPPSLVRETPSAAATATESSASVWYIVPDRYPTQSVLEGLGYEAGDFFDALSLRDFEIVVEARANYPSTALSLASSWNLDYLDETAITLADAVALLEDPVMGQLLDDAGYQYRHLGSWPEFSSTSASADEVLTLHGASEFWFAFEPATILPTIWHLLDVPGPPSVMVTRHVEHATHQLEVLDDLARREPAGKEFVLAHLVLPHSPYAFAADGTVLPMAEMTPEGAREGYGEQLQYLNDRLLSLIDALLRRETPPIIVLLSDEGLYPASLVSQGGLDEAEKDPRLYSARELRRKYSILAAVYDPTGRLGGLHDTATSVNITRAVVDAALGTDSFPPLPDESYQWRDDSLSDLVPVPPDVLHPPD